MNGYEEDEDYDPGVMAEWLAWSAAVDREMALGDDPAWVEVPA